MNIPFITMKELGEKIRARELSSFHFSDGVVIGYHKGQAVHYRLIDAKGVIKENPVGAVLSIQFNSTEEAYAYAERSGISIG